MGEAKAQYRIVKEVFDEIVALIGDTEDQELRTILKLAEAALKDAKDALKVFQGEIVIGILADSQGRWHDPVLERLRKALASLQEDIDGAVKRARGINGNLQRTNRLDEATVLLGALKTMRARFDEIVVTAIAPRADAGEGEKASVFPMPSNFFGRLILLEREARKLANKRTDAFNRLLESGKEMRMLLARAKEILDPEPPITPVVKILAKDLVQTFAMDERVVQRALKTGDITIKVDLEGNTIICHGNVVKSVQ